LRINIGAQFSSKDWASHEKTIMKLKTLIAGVFMLAGACSFSQHGPADSTATEDVEKHSIQLFAPNAFTPDGDYYNDTWKVFIEGNDSYDFHLTIFDRSGQIVWESYNSAGEWDGNYGGHVAPNGVYGWVIQTKDSETDKIHQFKGHITLLR
jgi:gliding motility-associated-like protein